jgi:hypothetical protein
VEAFTVICETCRARLKVRDARIIGEIHACPKCESMVLIAPPANWTSQRAEVGASEVVQPVADFAHVTSPSEDAAEAFAEVAALLARPQANVGCESSTAPSAATASFHEAGASSWVSTLTSAKLLMGSLGAFLVLLSGGIALFVFSSGDPADEDSSPTAVVAPKSTLPPRAIATNSVPQGPPSREMETAAEDAYPVEVVAAKPASEHLDEMTAARPLDNSRSEDTSAVPKETPLEQTAGATSPPVDEMNALSAVQSPAEPASTDDRRAPVLKFDPLDFDPSQLSLAATSATNGAPTPGSVADEQIDDVDAPAVAEAAEPADELEPPAENPSITVRLGPIIQDGAAPRSAANPFDLYVESLTLAEMPLEHFLAAVSDMAGVAITLDPVALELSGVSARAAVTVNTGNTSLGQLLKSVLSKHRLELVEREGDAQIALANGNEHSTKVHDITDLLEPAAKDAQFMATLIQQFVSPTTWQRAGGHGTIDVDGGKLRIDQAKTVHHEIVVFCERLRLARGLRLRTRYPAERLSIESPYQQIHARLHERTTFTFLPWTRLADVVRHWEHESGVTMLVDWGSLGDEQLTPSTPLTCSAVDQPWHAALDQILEPLGLAWWAVDGSTIELSTQDALEGIQRTEFLVVPPAVQEKFGGGPKLLEAFTNELLEGGGTDAAADGRPTTHFDAPSGRLIVRGTPHVLRFVAEQLTGSPRP